MAYLQRLYDKAEREKTRVVKCRWCGRSFLLRHSFKGYCSKTCWMEAK